MMHQLNAKVVKIIGTKYPRLRTMIRNHPYTKIVGMSVVKCLLEEMQMKIEAISDDLLEEMLDKGIALYHENEEEIRSIPVIEHKRRVLCDGLRQFAEEHLESAAG
ncbi:hypothetical protein [Hydrogenimonas urashimensis]|uniref:hypothetical protein n=1 Tax=Hydrogenimonas urashimensis TaxID=2740515 RepID=UPI001915E280|nr:hypothetical protein [Hydrogenimonas urashimensis]